MCQCPPGWTGKNCTSVGDLNGGTCINQAGCYVCQCPPGWTGNDCKVGELSPLSDCFPI